MIPAVSVCVPTHNRAASLRLTLEAMLRQTEQDFEIVVGDDASTDDTAQTVAAFADPRIHYYRHPTNVGIYANWNALIAQARGRFVAIYHDHDTYLPTIIERSLALLEKHPDMAFVHTAVVLVNNDGVPIDVWANEFDEVMPGPVLRERFSSTTRGRVCAASTMVRRDAYAAAGPFDIRYGLIADRRMWFRLTEAGSVGYVREPQALILGRSRGDPTERFALDEVLGNYQISIDGLRELWPHGSVERWVHESGLRREVHRDLVAALLKTIVFGTRHEIEERAALVASAMSGWEARIVRAAVRAPLRPLLKTAARRVYERRLAARQARALDFVRRSPTLREYLPAQYR